LLLFTGDIGSRTIPQELLLFLEWFKDQKADCKVFIGGNHDISLDLTYLKNIDQKNIFQILKHKENYQECKTLIKEYEKYNIHYLENSSMHYNGFNIYGSPYSPSFHKEHWGFNKDRGEEIKREWMKIPKNTDILLTHTPPYKILDDVMECKQENELDPYAGCKDLFNVIKNRLINLKLHCFGHIHNQYGVIQKDVSNTRKVLFSNGAILNNRYKSIVIKPLIINL
jgi:Icc-related predicted phosphoesterase